MNLEKIIKETIAQNKAENTSFTPLIYLTIPQANEIVKAQKQLQAEIERLKLVSKP